MSRLVRSVVWVLLMTVVTVGCTPFRANSGRSIVDLDQPRPGNERQSRFVTLPNGLEVWLMSDPNAQKSTAALDVRVGSLEDPWEHLGLAHFLEHLLFLGTEKYPDVEEYKEYLEKNQGMSNAYTAAERTNYHFEVSHTAFEGALDRFAQFFIAPLFTPEFIEREMNAVNSEHQKNLQDDYWRARMVKRSLHRDGHPRQKFSTGDLQTLANATRDQLIAFYEQYYSANVMKLCILSAHPLDTQEQWVREKFAVVENRNVEPSEYSSDVFDPEDLPQFIQVKPLSDTLTLELTFATPPTTDLYEAKPHRLLGALIGDEGPGSLLSLLKRENLATSLSSGARTESYAAYFNVNVGLTEAGRADVDRVIELFFAYVRLLHDRGLEPYYFDDQRTMSELDYYFRENQEGTEAISWLAGQMQWHPASEVERRMVVLEKYDPAGFLEYLSHLRPERMRVTLVAPDVEVDSKEKAYGTEYSVTKFSDARLERWQQVEPDPALAYPAPNPYIPSDVALLPVAADASDPVAILQDLPGEFWFQPDERFRLPRARMSILFASDLVSASPRNRILTKILVGVIREAMNEWQYPAVEAGLSAVVTDEGNGIRLVVDGYSQRLTDLLRAAAERVVDARVEPATFAAIRTQVERDLVNVDFGQAYSLAFYELNLLCRYPGVHRSEYVDLVSTIQQADVEAFANELFAEMTVEGAAYGNLRREDVETAVRDTLAVLTQSTLPADRLPGGATVEIPAGQRFARVLPSKANNNAWIKYVQFGPRDPRTEAIVRSADAILKSGFYAEMRTKQQLGYVVASGALTNFERVGLWFLIQSGTHSAGDCSTRAETYLHSAVEALSAMTAEQFAVVRSALVAELTLEEKDFAESLERLLFEGVELHGRIGYRRSVAEQLETIELHEVLAELRSKLVGADEASFSVYVDAKGSTPSVPIDEKVIESRAELMQSVGAIEGLQAKPSPSSAGDGK